MLLLSLWEISEHSESPAPSRLLTSNCRGSFSKHNLQQLARRNPGVCGFVCCDKIIFHLEHRNDDRFVCGTIFLGVAKHGPKSLSSGAQVRRELKGLKGLGFGAWSLGLRDPGV